jgi:hypothetical protein
LPEISRFFGIIITMYHREHPPAHFHARYGGDKASIEIESLRVVDGGLPPRALGLVMEWAAIHRDELREDWTLAQAKAALKRIAPLE